MSKITNTDILEEMTSRDLAIEFSKYSNALALAELHHRDLMYAMTYDQKMELFLKEKEQKLEEENNQLEFDFMNEENTL